MFNNKQGFNRAFTPKKTPAIIALVLAIIAFALFVYIAHVPFNFLNPGFIVYIIIFFGFIFVYGLILNLTAVISVNTYKKLNKFASITLGVVIATIFITSFASSSIFNAKEYANRINVVPSEFSTIEEVDFTKTPIIDRASTEALGDRVMGQMPELVSQFEVSSDYTQISYKNSVYRVTPLEYADTIKYFTNRKNGIPAYIAVNSTTGETELVKLSDLGLDGMRYVPSALFNENLERKLQLTYPTTIFGSPSFEIDEDGHPWYVCTTYTYKAMGTKLMVDGVVLFDPITGDSTKYDDPLDAPSWVDRIYPEGLVMQEVNNHGALKDGYLNSMFGQKNVYQASEGYNYLEIDGDIWIYSGITSANSDAANLGFVLVNLRTHECRQIQSAGADEFSAMKSAEGNVKNFGYHATFPLLVNVNNKPVYLMSLKDDAGLIKMYAMVDATDYQKVATATIDQGLDDLKKAFVQENFSEIISDNLKEKSFTIKSVKLINSDGKTKAFIEDQDGLKYKVEVNAKNEDIIAFLKDGDNVQISYLEADVNLIKDIK